MDWIDPKKNLPPQGKKVLYLKDGDVYVVQRFGKYWLPIPFFDSEYSLLDEPELWADIQLPQNLTGKIFFMIDDAKYETDSFEKYYPEAYNEFIEATKEVWKIK